jgi:hypothetical protein
MDSLTTLNTYNKSNLTTIGQKTNVQKSLDENTTQIKTQQPSNKDNLALELKDNKAKVTTNPKIEFVDTTSPSESKIVNGVRIEYYESSVKDPNPLKLPPCNIDINGIFNDYNDAQDTKNKIKEQAGKPVVLFHNPTYKLSDPIEATASLSELDTLRQLAKFTNSMPSDAPDHIKTLNPVKGFFNVLEIGSKRTIEQEFSDSLYSVIKSGKAPRIMAHSQGAAITASALQILRNRLLDETHNVAETERKMATISVLTIGGYASRGNFPSEVKLVKIENTSSNKQGKDVIPFIANNLMNSNNNIGELKYNSKLAHGVIDNNPKSSKVKKAILHSMVNHYTSLAENSEKFVRFQKLQVNAALSIPIVLKNRLENGSWLNEHKANEGYVDQAVVDNEIKKFFK